MQSKNQDQEVDHTDEETSKRLAHSRKGRRQWGRVTLDGHERESKRIEIHR